MSKYKQEAEKRSWGMLESFEMSKPALSDIVPAERLLPSAPKPTRQSHQVETEDSNA